MMYELRYNWGYWGGEDGGGISGWDDGLGEEKLVVCVGEGNYYEIEDVS